MPPDLIPDSALHTISGVLEANPDLAVDENTAINLWACCKKIFLAFYIKPKEPVRLNEAIPMEEQLGAICETNQMRFRKINTSSKDWMRFDNGPLLCFLKDSGEAAAIIPGRFGKYKLIVPVLKINRALQKTDLANISDFGFVFYRMLPDTPLTWKSIIQFARPFISSDFRDMLLFQGSIAVLSLMLPIATGILFDLVIPNAASSLLMQFTIALIVNAIVLSLMNVNQVIAIIRIRLKLNAQLQAAIWERLIRLPLSFFRKYNTGDLATRAGAIDDIQQLITSSILITIVSGLLSIITLLFLFYYSPSLALATVFLVIILAAFSLVNYFFQLGQLRPLLFYHGRLTGFTWQVLACISKLKISNSLEKAFEQWSKIFALKSTHQYLSGKIVVNLSTFTTFLSIFNTMVLFTMVYLQREDMSFGTFIAFNAAFGQFFAAIFALMNTFAAILRIIPIYERVEPIIQAIPELTQTGADPGSLKGKIDIVQLGYKYQPDSQAVFKEIDLSIKAGSKVLITGASGSGKSTLFRLLTGFEQPLYGTIYYDGFDLKTLNLLKLRQQMGVVLQDSVLFPGTILHNISGSRETPLSFIWEILEWVDFKEEVEDMPMGLNTIITDTGQTLSMGQRQRILLARALSKRPKILLLDEATSALDQLTRQKIDRNLSTLDLTRIISTHKVEYYEDCDQIFLLQDGYIKEIPIDGTKKRQ